MEGYEQECAEVFLKNQCQLLPEPVVFTVEEALEFLEECEPAVVDSVEGIRRYWEDEGMYVKVLTDQELLDQPEIFKLPSGKYLIVEA